MLFFGLSMELDLYEKTRGDHIGTKVTIVEFILMSTTLSMDDAA